MKAELRAASRLLIAGITSVAALYRSDATAPNPSLADAYRGRLKIGAAVEPFELDGEDGALLVSQFNSVVAENVMKPSRIQPREGEFVFAPADSIAAFWPVAFRYTASGTRCTSRYSSPPSAMSIRPSRCLQISVSKIRSPSSI